MVQCPFIDGKVISPISDMNEVVVNLDIYSKPYKNPYSSILHMNNVSAYHLILHNSNEI